VSLVLRVWVQGFGFVAKVLGFRFKDLGFRI
jgi:hypothetical protein